MIVDSGERREFSTGAVRDIQEGKGRCDLLPLDVIATVYDINGNDEIADVLGLIYKFCSTGDHMYLYRAITEFIGKNISVHSSTAFLELSKHFEEGALKYGEYNWQKGIPTHCYIDSAVRHYLKYKRGDSDERHDRAFIWNLVCCIWTCEHMPELNDYKKEETNEQTTN